MKRKRANAAVIFNAFAGILAMAVVAYAPVLLAADSAPVQPDEGFPWGIHLITIPLTVAFGILVGWSLRERKAQADAKREADAKAVAVAGLASDEPQRHEGTT